MNRKQTAVFWGTVLLVALCIALPPYGKVISLEPLITEFMGYYPLSNPPDALAQIDTQRLLLQIGLVLVFGGASLYALRD